jgi:predicted dehydrogenase
MSKLGVGIVGCGNISTIYMHNMPKFRDLKLIACADLRPEAAQAQATQFGIEALSIEALLVRPDIQIIVNLTTPNAHYGVSQAAFDAGKHVFGEKPITVEANEGAALVAEAARRGLKLGCAPDTFLGGGGRTARELVDAGRIGKVLYGSCFLMSHGMEHWHPDPTFFFKPGGGADPRHGALLPCGAHQPVRSRCASAGARERRLCHAARHLEGADERQDRCG